MSIKLLFRKDMFKKILLLLIMSLLTLFSYSQTNINVSQEYIKTAVNKLSSIEGYIFLTKGQSRVLPVIFDRTDLADFSGVHYTSTTENIAAVNSQTGEVTGINYGETLLTILDDKDTEHTFLVFVCPTVTIVSPEGAIYSHQKVYGQPMKIEFTQSKDYVINCVMATHGYGDAYDVTDKIIDGENGKYISDDNITADVVYTISMQNIQAGDDFNNAVDEKSSLRCQVVDNTVTFVAQSDDDRNPAGQSIYYRLVDGANPAAMNNTLDNNGSITLYESGIYLIWFENDYTHTYKIVIR